MTKMSWEQVQLYYYRTVLRLVLKHLHHSPERELDLVWLRRDSLALPSTSITVYSWEASDTATSLLCPIKMFEAEVGEIEFQQPNPWEFFLVCQKTKDHAKAGLLISIGKNDRVRGTQDEVNSLFAEGTSLHDIILSWCRALRDEISSSAAISALT